MHDQFSNSQQIRKPAVTSKGGIVAAQSRRAAEVGASVLAAGGDCVDALIATTFALGVLEPWMSGVGGGGAVEHHRAATADAAQGSSTPSANVVAITASTQSPPSASTAAPTSAAFRDCAATMPPLEVTAGLRICWV